MGSRSRTSIWSARWREKDGPAPIDSTGQLADGTPLERSGRSAQAVLSRSDAFMTTATEKLMTYALGRPVHDYDMPMVRDDRPPRGAKDNRFSSLLSDHRERCIPEACEEVRAGSLSDRPAEMIDGIPDESGTCRGGRSCEARA